MLRLSAILALALLGLAPSVAAGHHYTPPGYMKCLGDYDHEAYVNVCYNPDPTAGKFDDLCLVGDICAPIPNQRFLTYPWGYDMVYSEVGCNQDPTFSCSCQYLPRGGVMILASDDVAICHVFLPETP